MNLKLSWVKYFNKNKSLFHSATRHNKGNDNNSMDNYN